MTKSQLLLSCRGLSGHSLKQVLANKEQKCFTASAICPESETLFLGMETGQILIYEMTDSGFYKRSEYKVYGHGARINQLFYNHKGRVLVSCDTEGNLFVFEKRQNTHNFSKICSMHHWEAAITSVYYCHDQKILFVACADQTIQIFRQDLYKKFLEAQIIENAHTLKITRLAYSSKLQALFSSSKDQTIKIFKNFTKPAISKEPTLKADESSKLKQKTFFELSTKLEGFGVGVTCLDYCDIDNVLVAGTTNYEIKIYKLQKGEGMDFQEISSIDGNMSGTSCILYDPHSKSIFATTYDGTILHYRQDKLSQEYSEIKEFREPHNGFISDICFNYKKGNLITCSDDFTAMVTNMERRVSFTQAGLIKNVPGRVLSQYFCEKHKMLFIATDSNRIHIRRMENEGRFEDFQTLNGNFNSGFSMNFVTESGLLFASDDSGKIIVWKMTDEGFFEKGKAIRVLEETKGTKVLDDQQDEKNCVTAIYTWPQKDLLFAGMKKNGFKIFKKQEGNKQVELKMGIEIQETKQNEAEFVEIFHFPDIQDPIKSFEYDDETGHLFVSTAASSSIIVLQRMSEAGGFKKAYTLDSHESEIQSFSLSRNQKKLFTSSTDGKVIEWSYGPSKDLEKKEFEKTYNNPKILKNSSEKITSLYYNDKSNMLVLGSVNGNAYIRVLTADGDYRLIQTLKFHDRPISSIHYDSISKILFLGSNTKSCSLWIESTSPRYLSLDIEVLYGEYEEPILSKKYLEQKIKEVSPRKFSTFLLPNGLSLLALAILGGFDQLCQTLLDTIGFKDERFVYNKQLYPIDIALQLNNYLVLDALGRFFKTHNCIQVTQDLFFTVLNSSSDIFKKAVCNGLFWPPNLDTTNIPAVALLNEADLPHFKRFTVPDLDVPDVEFLLTGQKDKGGTINTVKYKRSSIKINWKISEPFIHQFLKKFQNSVPLVHETDLKYIITYLWRQYAVYAIIYAIIYVTFLLTVFFNVIWCKKADQCKLFFNASPGGSFDQNILYLMIITRFWMYTLYSIILIAELMVIYRNFKEHFYNIFNILDALVLIGFIPISIGLYFDSKETERVWAFSYAFYLFILGFRGITQLRVINSIRYLITMILRVFYDMMPFFTIFGCAILLFSCVELELSKSPEGTIVFDPGLDTLFNTMNTVYDIGYGNWGDATLLAPQFFVLFIIETLLFPLVMFNLLIAIISNTYEEFEQEKELKDIQELFEILQDLSSIFSFLDLNYNCKTRKNMIAAKNQISDGTKYLHIVDALENNKQQHFEDIKQQLEGKIPKKIIFRN